MARIATAAAATTTATIVLALAAFAGLLTHQGSAQSPLNETARLEQVQIDFVEASGSSVEILAQALRDHLRLGDADLEVAETDCSLGQMEHGHHADHELPADPQSALAELIDDLRENGPTELKHSIDFLTAGGGSIRWNPARIDDSGYMAVQTTKNLHVGSSWLQSALDNASSVHANIQHEVGGHLFYGSSIACRIVQTALVATDEVDADALFLDLAYPESEIYAELKELPFVTEQSVGDDPAVDIEARISQIRSGFPIEVAEMILASMDARFSADDTLTPAALHLFRSLV